MPRRRRTFAQSMRSLVLELVVLIVFVLFMWNVFRPWATNTFVDTYRSTLPTPHATVNAAPSN
jgi:hypothetical protein